MLSILIILSLIILSLQCKTDEDCSLNGVCSKTSATCTCDAGWTADDCGQLNIQPASRNSGYNRTAEGISSWCTSIVQDPKDKNLHHAFISEFTNNCGLNYWSPYSRIIRADSRTGPAGPYTFAAEVVGRFAHNPTVIYSPADRLYLMYHIGCPQEVEATCTSSQFTCGPGNSINGESGISVLSSPDLRNWKLHGQVLQGKNNGAWNADVTNPAPGAFQSLQRHIPPHHGWGGWGSWRARGSHERGWGRPQNHDITLVYRGCPYNCSGNEQITIAEASYYEGHYTQLNNNKQIFENSAEDPFIWQDARGNYHILVHSLEPEGGFGSGPKVGRHAFSRSIKGPWTFNEKTLAFSTLVPFDDGTEVNFYRRERPQLVFSNDEKMTPMFLATGVQERQEDNPMSYSLVVPIGK